MTIKREKNNHESGASENGRRNLSVNEENKYTDENTNVTDTDAAETSQRVRHASQVSGNDIEEGDEDYDDENEENKI